MPRFGAGIRCALIAALALAMPHGSATAQSQQPIRFVVQAAAGGSIDTYARIIGEHMSTTLGRPIINEIKVGANGNVAALYVLDNPPDGSIVFVGTQSTLEINPSSAKNLRWKPADFIPVFKGVDTLLVLAAHPSMPVRTFDEWVAHVRANKGKLIYANYGAGTVSHLLGFQVAERYGLDYTQVPYRGNAPQMIDLIAGHVKFGFTQLQGMIEPVKAGQLLALVQSGPKRSELMPGVPTFADVGQPDLSASAWFGLLVKAGTPPDIIKRLETAAVAAHADAGVRKKLDAQGYIVNGQMGAAFQQSIIDQGQRWAKIVKASGYTSSD